MGRTLPENRMLYSLLYFVEQSADIDFHLETDIPVAGTFQGEFDRYSFRSAVANFLLHHGIAFSDSYFADNVSIRDLAGKLSRAPVVPDSDFPELLRAIGDFIVVNEEERCLAVLSASPPGKYEYLH